MTLVRMDRRGDVVKVRKPKTGKKSRKSWIDREVDRYRAGLLSLEGLVEAGMSELGWKYSPDQPRVPAGQSEGGRWTTSSGGIRFANLSPQAGNYAKPTTVNIAGYSRPVTYYKVEPGETIAPDVRAKLSEVGAAVAMSPIGDMYISGDMLHGDIIDAIGDTSLYDKYTRVLISGGGVRADSVHMGTFTEVAGARYWRTLDESERATVDTSAARKLWSVTKKLVDAGFPRDRHVMWRMLSGEPRIKIEGTLGEFADGEYKSFDDIKQYPEPTPRGSALPPLEGDIEITWDDVEEWQRDWDRKAPREARGLLDTGRGEV